MKINKNIIVGGKVNFRKITELDLEVLIKWRNSKEVYQYNNQFVLLNMFLQKKWFKSIIRNKSNQVMFVVTNKKNKPVGICGLIHVDEINRSADCAIILGVQKLHGKGLGSEILDELVEYGFTHLGLHRIGAEIFSYNKISSGLFKKLGFKYEVTLREALWRDNRWWDIDLYSLLKHEKILQNIKK